MRTDKALWERVYMGPRSTTYVNVAKLIGHLGCAVPVFVEASQKLPDFDKYRYESAVNELTTWKGREKGRLEFSETAKKVLRPILGPEPTDPEYVRWWRSRLVSVEQMKAEGKTVDWADSPPVPLPDERPKVEEQKAERPKPEKPAKAKKPRKKAAKSS